MLKTSVFTTIILHIFFHASESASHNSNICVTSACQEEAHRIREDINSTVEPCDNFYDFVCGQYVEHYGDSYEERLWSEKESIIMNLLEGKTILDDYRTQQLIVSLYESCMNTSRIENLGLSPALSILEHIGGWPVTKNDSVFTMNLTTALFELWKNGMYIDVFFSVVVPTTYNEKSSNKDTVERIKITCLDLAQFFMSGGNYDFNRSEAYFQYMNETAILFGADPATAGREMREVWNLESMLNNLSCEINGSASPISLNKMDETYKGINWTEFFIRYTEPFSPIYENLPLYVMTPKYLESVMPLLKNISSRTLGNYISWTIVRKFPEYLSENMTQIYKKYCGENRCFPSRGKRKDFCINVYKQSFKLTDELEFAFEEMYIPKDTIASAVNLTKYVQNQLRRTFAASTWMKDEILSELVERMNKTYLVIGFPPNWTIETVDELYTGLYTDRMSFYMNMINTTAFNKRHSDRRVKNKGIYQYILPDHGTFVVNNSYEIVEKNDAYSKSIFFNKTRPNSMNFAGLGDVFIQKVVENYLEDIIYSEDDDSDEDKEHENDEDVSESDGANDNHNEKTELQKKLDCFKDRYDNASIYPEETVDWETIRMDILRVFSGIDLGYRSYLLYSATSSGLTLPGLNYTSQQLYWINSGRTFCSRKYFHTDTPKLIANFTNLYFSTSSNFRQDWNCSKFSKMSNGPTCKFF